MTSIDRNGITLATLLITAAPPAATSSGESGGNPGAAVLGTSENYGDEWNNYGHDVVPPKPAQIGDARGSYSSNGNDPIERHAEVVARLGEGHLR